MQFCCVDACEGLASSVTACICQTSDSNVLVYLLLRWYKIKKSHCRCRNVTWKVLWKKNSPPSKILFMLDEQGANCKVSENCWSNKCRTPKWKGSQDKLESPLSRIVLEKKTIESIIGARREAIIKDSCTCTTFGMGHRHYYSQSEYLSHLTWAQKLVYQQPGAALLCANCRTELCTVRIVWHSWVAN